MIGADGNMTDDVVIHYFNPELPDLQGDHVGWEGVRKLFAELGQATGGMFKVTPDSFNPVGDELLVMQTRNNMAFPDRVIEVDVVLVWRIVDGKINEIRYIPAVHTATANTVSQTLMEQSGGSNCIRIFI